MLDDGDEVLIPAPDYPLWTASTSLAGGAPVHYLLRRGERLAAGPRRPPQQDHRRAQRRSSSSTRTTRPAPSTPTAVLREHRRTGPREHGLVVMADEIYDKILYDDADAHCRSRGVAPDVFTLTFNGLSKAYRLAGFRAGLADGHRAEAARRELPRGHHDPGQHAAVRERPGAARRSRPRSAAGRASTTWCCPAGGCASSATPRWPRSSRSPASPAWCREARCTCSPPGSGAVPDRGRPARSCWNCCAQQHVLVVQGTGFNWPHPDHLRIVTLPRADDLTEAIGRIGAFLGRAISRRSAG